VAVASPGPYAVCTSLQTDNHASTPPLSFYRPDAFPAAQPTASKHPRLLKNKKRLYYSVNFSVMDAAQLRKNLPNAVA